MNRIAVRIYESEDNEKIHRMWESECASQSVTKRKEIEKRDHPASARGCRASPG
jgi:hypothetical protein